MKARHELGIPCGGKVSREDIKEGDVIEINPKGNAVNRRYIVDSVNNELGLINLDGGRYTFSIDDINLVGVIRGYPSDEELYDMNLTQLKIDCPDKERGISPVFTAGMKYVASEGRQDFIYGPMQNWLRSNGYAWNKRWILRDTLKFYSFNGNISYFI